MQSCQPQTELLLPTLRKRKGRVVSKRALAFLLVQFTFVTFLMVIMSACGASSSAPTQTTGNPPPTTTPPAVTPPVTPPTPPPQGTITSINHIIMMFQENRSFDHYFAHLNTYRKVNFGIMTNDVDTLDKVGLQQNPADADAPLHWSSANATTVMINGKDAGGTSGTM